MSMYKSPKDGETCPRQKEGKRWKKMKRLCKAIIDEVHREADFILRERVCICNRICLFFKGKKIHFH